MCTDNRAHGLPPAPIRGLLSTGSHGGHHLASPIMGSGQTATLGNSFSAQQSRWDLSHDSPGTVSHTGRLTWASVGRGSQACLPGGGDSSLSRGSVSVSNASASEGATPRQRGVFIADAASAGQTLLPVNTVEAALDQGLLPTPVSSAALINSVRETSSLWYRPNLQRAEG
ncbi:unnamed protein product [Protopolystoma xenopodis]|uniref:Uncharacterized protein n=1 Tax=Protopolystoma xenopodis TaxID=117903 RepID=A0A3S5ADM4_9PLAT|nr:unnamed protein product [Protopolystoma xenopodis]